MKKICFVLFLPVLVIGCKKETASIPGVNICSQSWMSQNLTVTTYRNGDSIPHITDNNEWINDTTGAWRWLNDDSANNNIGKLYNWYAVHNPRGLAPKGWHITTGDEWNVLANYINAYGPYDNSNGDFLNEISGRGLVNFTGSIWDASYGDFSEQNELFCWINAADPEAENIFMPGGGSLPGSVSVSKENGITVRCIKDK